MYSKICQNHQQQVQHHPKSIPKLPHNQDTPTTLPAPCVAQFLASTLPTPEMRPKSALTLHSSQNHAIIAPTNAPTFPKPFQHVPESFNIEYLHDVGEVYDVYLQDAEIGALVSIVIAVVLDCLCAIRMAAQLQYSNRVWARLE